LETLAGRGSLSATCSCSFLLLRGLHLGLGRKNLRQLRVRWHWHVPTSDRRLEDMKCAELSFGVAFDPTIGAEG
jgi:hypothetical protein